jgi:hypothetical protein
MNKACETRFVHVRVSTIKYFMKKILVTVGLAALGASSLHAQYAPGISSEEMSKPWSLGVSLRGFYDDNYLTLPKSLAVSTYGVEVSPAVSLNHSVDQTSYSLSYIFDYRYYEQTSTSDSSHQFNGSLHHSFSERYSMTVSDSFVIAQQPTVLDTTVLSTPLRVNGNNVHNTGTLSGTAALTPTLDLQASYVNNLYAYQQTFGDVFNPVGAPISPSYSALLDRIEQRAALDLDWKVQPDLTGILGYEYGHTGYTSDEAIIYNGPVGSPLNVYSKERNNDSDFFYVGADKDFTSELHGSIRAGGEYVDYYAAPAKTSKVSPYVDASVTWQYLQGSTAQLGVKHLHNATDVVGGVGSAANPVLDEESTATYASVNQKLGDVTASVLGQFQYSEFNGGGALNGKAEDFLILGLNLAYRITPYLNGEAGYNWNKLVSDVSGRDYTRNQIYIGVRATY